MDSFGIDRLALPKFGIDVFRLPNFGQTSNGASKGRFHESLVDAWFMSGYKNGDAPSGIRGVKGNVITLHNFLFAGNAEMFIEISKLAYRWVAIYKGKLTTEQIEEEKVKLENKWESKLNKS